MRFHSTNRAKCQISGITVTTLPQDVLLVTSGNVRMAQFLAGRSWSRAGTYTYSKVWTEFWWETHGPRAQTSEYTKVAEAHYSHKLSTITTFKSFFVKGLYWTVSLEFSATTFWIRGVMLDTRHCFCSDALVLFLGCHVGGFQEDRYGVEKCHDTCDMFKIYQETQIIRKCVKHSSLDFASF